MSKDVIASKSFVLMSLILGHTLIDLRNLKVITMLFQSAARLAVSGLLVVKRSDGMAGDSDVSLFIEDALARYERILDILDVGRRDRGPFP
jgi:hypothetical protein